MIIIKSGPQIIIDPTALTVSQVPNGEEFVVAATTKDNRIYQVWPWGDYVCRDEAEAAKVVGYLGNLMYKHCAGSPLPNYYIDVKGVYKNLKTLTRAGKENGHVDKTSEGQEKHA